MYRFSTPAAPWRHSIPRDGATVPRLTHTAALAILGERTGGAPELGERWFSKVGPPINDHYVYYPLPFFLMHKPVTPVD